MPVTVSVCFPVSGLWVRESTLGARVEIEAEGQTVWLEIPDKEDAGVLHGGQSSPTSEWAVELSFVRISTEFPSDLTADDPELVAGSDEKFQEAVLLGRDGIERGSDILSRVLAWARTAYGQYMIGPTDHPPETHSSPTMHDANGRKFRHGHGGTLRVARGHDREALSVEDLTSIARRVASSTGPTPADTLLADACYYAFSLDPTPAIALLLAAISSEVRIKTFLEDHARDEQAPILDILRQGWETSIAVRRLYDKGLKAITGRSLREDDQNTYDNLSQLFTTRNDIVHGKEANLTDISELMAAARQAANYLSKLPEELTADIQHDSMGPRSSTTTD